MGEGPPGGRLGGTDQQYLSRAPARRSAMSNQSPDCISFLLESSMPDAPTAAYRPGLLRRALTGLLWLLPGHPGRGLGKGAGTPRVAEFDAQLLAAADAVVSLARRALYDVTWPGLPPGERLAARGEVTVEDVAEIMHLAHGLAFIPPARVAAALRCAFEARAGYVDLTTDAYNC